MRKKADLFFLLRDYFEREEKDMMKKRVLALTLAMCMGTSLLAGCGGGKEDTGAAPQKEEGASTESEVVLPNGRAA